MGGTVRSEGGDVPLPRPTRGNTPFAPHDIGGLISSTEEKILHRKTRFALYSSSGTTGANRRTLPG